MKGGGLAGCGEKTDRRGCLGPGFPAIPVGTFAVALEGLNVVSRSNPSGPGAAARYGSGSCCVMQWMLPPPAAMSRDGTITT